MLQVGTVVWNDFFGKSTIDKITEGDINGTKYHINFVGRSLSSYEKDVQVFSESEHGNKIPKQIRGDDRVTTPLKTKVPKEKSTLKKVVPEGMITLRQAEETLGWEHSKSIQKIRSLVKKGVIQGSKFGKTFYVSQESVELYKNGKG